MVTRIVFVDLSQRERLQLEILRPRLDSINKLRVLKLQKNEPTIDEDNQLTQIGASKLAGLDTLYQKVARFVARSRLNLADADPLPDTYKLQNGLFNSQCQDVENTLAAHERQITAMIGLLLVDGFLDPNAKDIGKRLSGAQGEFFDDEALFFKVFDRYQRMFKHDLQSQVDAGLVSPEIVNAKPFGPALTDTVAVLKARDLAQAVRRLAADGVKDNDPYLDSKIDVAFGVASGAKDGQVPSSIEIDLPDLEDAVDEEIIKENLHAVQAIYFAYMLEETRIFQVVERIVELFRQGLLPLGRRDTTNSGFSVGDYLFKYYKTTSERITETERRDLYLRCFGAPGGSAVGVEPNREFNELWLRFVSAVSSFARQQTVERLLRDKVPMSVSQEQIRKAGRDLGANLSRNGYGIAYFAATDLQQSIVEFRDVLQNGELRSAFGARDMWQVIDLVNVNYLGGARNSQRYRTQARAGAVVIRWLAKNRDRLRSVNGPVISTDQLLLAQNGNAVASPSPMNDPSDWDLVDACEQWLAVGGVQDQAVEQYAQPIESPTMTSRPIEMPRMARDALEAAGINLPGM